MEKMNPEVKAKLVDALRSGRYQQGQEMLKDGFSSDEPLYCCLGVLTDLYAKEKKIDFRRAGSSSGTGTMPSRKVCKWAGIPYDDGSDYSSESVTLKLAKMNDNDKSFKQIAAYIERYL